MSTHTIQSNRAFEEWMRAHMGFEDAIAKDLQPRPSAGARPSEITLVLTERLRGS